MKKQHIFTTALFFLFVALSVTTVRASSQPEGLTNDPKSIPTHISKKREIAEEKKDKIDKVSRVQINGTKTYPDLWPKDRLSELLSGIDTVLSGSEKEICNVQVPEEHSTICLRFKDGSKKIYCFFETDQKWYMQVDHSDIYCDAEFITDFIDFTTEGTTAEIIFPDPCIVELSKDFEVYDANYYFAADVLGKIKDGVSEDDAILSAKQKMTNELLLYEYALNHGYSCTEEEIEELMEQELVEIQSADNYDEYESYLHDLGTTYEEYWGKTEKSAGARSVVDKLWQDKNRSFRHGDDGINGETFDNWQQYWNDFLLQEVYTETAAYDTTEIEKVVDEAVEFYKEYKASQKCEE